jgi:hypothetical protein
MIKYENFPFDEIADAFVEKIAEGWTVFQKFTCAGCGQRLTIDVPNMMVEEGTCDKCSAVTDIRRDGCNYTLMTLPPEIVRELLKKG